MLYLKGAWSGNSGKAAIREELVRKVIQEKGRLSRGDLLGLRVRCFTDGLVLGSRWSGSLSVAKQLLGAEA